MPRMRWDGENLENIKELNLYMGTAGYEERAKSLFPGIDPGYLKRAIYNLRAKGTLPASKDVKPASDAEEPLDYEVESKKDRKIFAQAEEIRRLRRLYKETQKDAAGHEGLIQAIHDVLPNLTPVAVPPPIKVNGHIEEEELVLLLSDLHFGEVVSEAETGGISSFNLDIARRRFDYTIDKAIVIAKEKQKGFHYRKLNVFMLGDLISGLIHDELKENDEVAVVQQMMFAIEVISAGIQRLCQEFEQVHVASVVGNHGRVKESYYFKGKANNNFDYLVSKMLEWLLADQPNLTMDVPESFWSIQEVAGQKFMLSHGDFIKSWAGIPFYGMNRAYMKWRVLCMDYGISFDHMVIGHFHNPNVFTVVRGKMFINGSIKGGDEYSIGAISAACDPVQLMFGVNATRRGHTALWDINSAHIR